MIMVVALLATALGVALSTWLVAWWTLPLVAAVAAWLMPRAARPLLTVPIGAALGWSVLLGRAARAEGFERLLGLLASLVPVPPAALAALTVVVALVLAAGGALVADAGRGRPRDGAAAK